MRGRVPPPSLHDRLAYLAGRIDGATLRALAGGAWWAVACDLQAPDRAPRAFLAARAQADALDPAVPRPAALAWTRAALDGFDVRVPYHLRASADRLLQWTEETDAARGVVAGADVELALLGALVRAADPGARSAVWLRSCARPDLARRAEDVPLYLHLRGEGWCALLRAVPPVGRAPTFRAACSREAVAPC